MSINVDIKVTGPGGCFWSHMKAIQKAIEDRGGTCEVVDDYPHGEQVTDEQVTKSIGNGDFKVTLTANHLPWGG